MKNLLIGLVLSAAMSAPVFATLEPSVYCAELREDARAVMSERQSGTSMHMLMQVAGDRGVYKLMVKESFEKRQYRSKYVRDLVTSAYGNGWYKDCLKTLGGK